MKKIRCEMDSRDYIRVTTGHEYVLIDARSGSGEAYIALSPEKIRKLRKQLKRALIEIEGDAAVSEKEHTEKYRQGDRVYLIEGNGEGDDWCKSPTVIDIDTNVPVELLSKLSGALWELGYTSLDGATFTGYADEKSFGRRA